MIVELGEAITTTNIVMGGHRLWPKLYVTLYTEYYLADTAKQDSGMRVWHRAYVDSTVFIATYLYEVNN